MKEWYKNWFDSDLYNEIYAHRNSEDASQLINLILKNIDLKFHKDIFDCPCGNGRHSIELAKMGFKLTSMDLSKNLLKIFMQKLKTENFNISVFRGNILQIPVKKKFDVILNLFTSFGYFDSDEDNFSFFRQVKSMLNDNGKIIFDYFNPEFVRNKLVQNEKKILNGKEIHISRSIENSFVIKRISIMNNSVFENYFEKVKMYSVKTIVNNLESFGFKIDSILGNYFGEKYTETQSERMILIISK